MVKLSDMRFFTYGTLQPDANLGFFESTKLSKYMNPIGKGVVNGDLVHIHNSLQEIDYPAVVNLHKSKNEVCGTIFEVADPQKAFSIMDMHEKFTPGLSEEESRKKNFYHRIDTKVRKANGEEITAKIYVLNRESDYYNEDFIIDHGVVTGGDWLVFIKSLKEKPLY